MEYILKIGILFKLSIKREEWIILDIAAMLYGLTVIPLYDTLGSDSINYCLNNSGCYNMFASSQSVDVLLNT